jgi:hypothetical protein
MAGNIKKKPDVNLEVAGRARNQDRSFSDEGRHDDVFDLNLEMGIKIPLSLARQNVHLVEQHAHEIQAQIETIKAQKRSLGNRIHEAWERYQIAVDGIYLAHLDILKAKEEERLALLRVEATPEEYLEKISEAVSKANLNLLIVQEAVIDAEEERFSALLWLLSEMGELPRIIQPSMPIR